MDAKNAAFTIVAQNFLAHAYTLASSVRRVNPEIDFYVFVADRLDRTLPQKEESVTHVEAKELPLENIPDLALKYDVTEFCTAIKPSCFEYLFKKLNYGKVTYFDPDIYIYSNLEPIIQILDRFDVLVTPHYVNAETEYTGIVPEGRILFAGIYNLGFIAFRNSPDTHKIIAWWKNRLESSCYADKIDGFHVDQKWMDFLPAFWGDHLCVSKHLGMNVAFWNLHERELVKEEKQYWIRSRQDPTIKVPLIFYHFSKSDPFDPRTNYREHREIEKERFRQYGEIYGDYALAIQSHRHDEYMNTPYLYNQFEDGTPVLKFHRRLYRRLLESGKKYPDPFSSHPGSFYSELKRNNLLPSRTGVAIDKLNERNLEGFGKKIRYLNRLMIILKKVIGTRNYFLLTKLLIRYCRPENQTFLIKSARSDYEFKNENI